MFSGSIPIVLDTLKQHYFIDRSVWSAVNKAQGPWPKNLKFSFWVKIPEALRPRYQKLRNALRDTLSIWNVGVKTLSSNLVLAVL